MRNIAFIGALLLSSWAQAETPPLRVLVSTAWTMPLGDIHNDQLTGGLTFDLYKALAVQLHTSLVQVPLPRKRLDRAALAGGFDIVCNTNPQWTDTPALFAWSKPLFKVSDVVVGSEGTAQIDKLEKLPPSAAISTVLGYRYPSLEPMFDSKRLRREDAVDENRVLLKLSAGRTPYAVAKSATLDWYLRNRPNHHIAAWRLPISNTDIFCAIPRGSAIASDILLGKLEQLQKSGRIEAMLKNYR